MKNTKQEVDASGVTLMQILLTHKHLDHVGARVNPAALRRVPVIGPEKEDEFWLQDRRAQSRMFVWMSVSRRRSIAGRTMRDRVSVGNVTLRCQYCPGHTAVYVVFDEQQFAPLIPGDVIFSSMSGAAIFLAAITPS